MAEAITCASCGRSLEPGTLLFLSRHRLDDGSFQCDDCARAGGPERDQRDVPPTMPNSNLPNTH